MRSDDLFIPIPNNTSVTGLYLSELIELNGTWQLYIKFSYTAMNIDEYVVAVARVLDGDLRVLAIQPIPAEGLVDLTVKIDFTAYEGQFLVGVVAFGGECIIEESKIIEPNNRPTENQVNA